MHSNRFLSIFAVVALMAAVHSIEVNAIDDSLVSTITVTRTLYGQPMVTVSESTIMGTPSSSMSQKDPTMHHTLDLKLPSQFSSLPQIISSLFPTRAPSSRSSNAAQPTVPALPPMSNREGIPSKSMDNRSHPPQNSVPNLRPISAPPQTAYPQMSTSSIPKIKEIYHTMMPLPGAPSVLPVVSIANPAMNPSQQPVANPSYPAANPNQPSNPSHPSGAKPTHPGMAVPSGNPGNNNMMHSLISVNPGMLNGPPPSGPPPMQTGGVPIVQVPLENNNQQIPPSSGSPLVQASSSVAAFNVWPTDLVPPPPLGTSSGIVSSVRPSSVASSSTSSSADVNNMNKKLGPSNNPISAGSSHQVVESYLVLTCLMALVAVF